MKKIGRYLTVGLVLVIGTAGVYKTELTQLYNTSRLFDADVIVSNFSSMEKMAPTTRIARSGTVDELGNKAKPLPQQFAYKDGMLNVQDWLTESNTTALVVMQGSDITFEQYYQGTAQFDPRISWSMAKSFLSAIFGVAVEDGLIPDLNVPVTDYVPSLTGSGYDGVTIKNVLQMSSGVYFDEDYGKFDSDINRFGRVMALGGSFDEFATSLNSGREQGTYMSYVSIDTHVIGMVLRAATGQSIADYFNAKLWSKLNTEGDAIYITDSMGEPMVLGGLNLISRDYLRMGKLYRDHGQLAGQQIIPAQWIEDSITPDASHLMPGKRDNADTHWGYGYQWWVPVDADQEFVAIGIYGQYIYVNRRADVVIVKNSADIGFMDNGYESKDHALAAFRAMAKSLAQE